MALYPSPDLYPSESIYPGGSIVVDFPFINLPTPLFIQLRETVLSIQANVTEVVIDGD
jgi:hypothetical protein